MKWILSVLGLDTDKGTALKIIRNLHETGLTNSFANYELDAVNLYFQLQFDLHILNQDDFDATESRLLVISLLSDKKKDIPNMINALNAMHSDLELASFLMGKALFLTENPQAKVYFEDFVAKNPTEINQTSALYYLYQIAVLEEDNTAQNRYYSQISAIDNPISYRDKWAKGHYEQTLTPELIHIRNAFDRADFETCLEFINENENSQNSAFLSYYACKSLAHLDKLSEAKSEFQKLISISSESEYYTPKAALLLAKLQTENQNKIEALYYLESAKAFDDYLYQKDIETQMENLKKRIEKL